MQIVRKRFQAGLQTSFVSSRVLAKVLDVQEVAVCTSKLLVIDPVDAAGLLWRRVHEQILFGHPVLARIFRAAATVFVEWVVWSTHDTGAVQLASIKMRELLASGRGRVECCSERAFLAQTSGN